MKISDTLVPLLNTYFGEIGISYVMYFLKGLPWDEFRPSTNDLFFLKNWLLSSTVPFFYIYYFHYLVLMLLQKSNEFQTANFILSQVHWGLVNNKKGVAWWDVNDPRLFVYAAMQRETAFMLVEVFFSFTLIF